MTSTAPEPTRREVGGYQLITKIGEGGMGVVHLARRPGGDRVALKVLRPHVVGDDEARARLAREVNSLSRVRSPRVAEIVDADPFGDVPFVATRYVPGLSLHDHVRDEGPIAGRDLTWFAYCLAEALIAVHRAGVLHRDVKPSNVLMEGRSPVLIDFGLARVAEDAKLTHVGWLLGTPGYLAPEILYGADATTASDVHCWAATIAFAGIGRPPFGRGPSAAVMDRVRRGEHDLTGLPEGLRPALTAALSPDPPGRPPLSVFLDWLGEQVGPPAAPPWSPRPGSVPPSPTMPLHAADGAGWRGGPDGPTTPLTDGGHPVPSTRVLPEPGPTRPAAHLASAHLTSAHLTSAHLTSAHLTSAHLTSAQPSPAQPSPAQPPPQERDRSRPPAYVPVGGPFVPPMAYVSPSGRATSAPAPGPEPAPGFAPERGRVVDPRAERWRRRALLLALAAAVAGGIAAYPSLVLTGLVLGAWLLRSLSLAAGAVRERRRVRGRKWSDAPRALVSTPWHLVRAIPGTLVLVLWSAGLAVAAGLLCFAAATGPSGTLAITGATFAAGLWWGPGATRLRQPVEAVVGRLTRQPVAWAGVLVFVLVLGWVAGLVAGELGPNWSPASSGPISSLDLPTWLR